MPQVCTAIVSILEDFLLKFLLIIENQLNVKNAFNAYDKSQIHVN